MTRGFLRFLMKETREIQRTWRLWVLPGMLLLFAVTSPPLAKAMPELLKSLGTGQQGVVITIPPPTYVDAYGQWVKNLSQLVLLALVVVSAGVVAGERASGTAVLTLTKPVSRSAFVAAKFVAQALFVTVAVALGTAICQGLTLAVFGTAPGAALWEAVGLWLAFAVFMVAVTTLLSCAMSTLAAAGAGLAVFFGLSLSALWGPMLRYTPAGLVGAPAQVLTGKAGESAWPLATALGGALLLVVAAAVVFDRQEL